MLGESGAREEARIVPPRELNMMTCSCGRAKAATSAPVARIAGGESGLVMTTSTEGRVGGRKSVRMP
jgi:hypothetical protein